MQALTVATWRRVVGLFPDFRFGKPEFEGINVSLAMPHLAGIKIPQIPEIKFAGMDLK